MVHETRHHDYDHDLDYDPSDAEKEEAVTSSAPASPTSSAATTPAKRRSSAPRHKKPAPATLKSRLAPVANFVLLLLANMGLSALLYSAVGPFTAGDLAGVSRTPSGMSEIASLVAFRAAELAIVWFGNYDGYDIAALTLLTHTPYLFLITAFYAVRPSTAVACAVVDVAAVLVPAAALRPLSAAHDAASPAGSIANRTVVSDVLVQAYVSSLGAAVYALTLALSLQQLPLTAHMAAHLDGLATLAAAHDPALLARLLLALAPLGIAAKVFIFTPATASKRDRRDAQIDRFRPDTASLAETVLYNVWGGHRRARVTVLRTGTLAALTLAHTWVQVYAHAAGADLAGAGAWAAPWTAAAALTGYVFWWVGNVDEVKQA